MLGCSRTCSSTFLSLLRAMAIALSEEITICRWSVIAVWDGGRARTVVFNKGMKCHNQGVADHPWWCLAHFGWCPAIPDHSILKAAMFNAPPVQKVWESRVEMKTSVVSTLELQIMRPPKISLEHQEIGTDLVWQWAMDWSKITNVYNTRWLPSPRSLPPFCGTPGLVPRRASFHNKQFTFKLLVVSSSICWCGAEAVYGFELRTFCSLGVSIDLETVLKSF